MRSTPGQRGCRAVLVVAALLLPVAGVPAAEYRVENYAIPEPLTTVPGDPVRGLEVMADRELGNCFGCHEVPVDAEFFGTTGPTLAGVARRLNAAQLRLRLVDSKQINPISMMPAYYKDAGLHRVLEEFKGKTILTAQEIEDVIAFLMTLDDNP